MNDASILVPCDRVNTARPETLEVLRSKLSLSTSGVESMAGFDLPSLDSQTTHFDLPDLGSQAAFGGHIIDLSVVAADAATNAPSAFVLPDLGALSVQPFSEAEIQGSNGGFLLDEAMEGPVQPGRDWNPGEDMGCEIGRLGKAAGNVGRQCQMLLCNVYLAMRRLSKKTLASVCRELPSVEGALSAVPQAAQAAALVTRVAGNTIRAVFDRLSKKAFQFDAAPAAPVSVQHVQRPRDQEKALRILVTEILANAVEGGSDESLLRRVARLEQHGLDLGDKYHDYRLLGSSKQKACLLFWLDSWSP